VLQLLEIYGPPAAAGAFAALLGLPGEPQGDVTVRCPRVTDAYETTIMRVVDGDTLDVEFDLGFGIRYAARVRLDGIDTPEMHSVSRASQEYADGLAAKKFVERWAAAYQSNAVTEVAEDRGKYGRVVAVIHPPDGRGMSLNAALVQSRHAKRKDYR
jgi:micrococcal nuclease